MSCLSAIACLPCPSSVVWNKTENLIECFCLLSCFAIIPHSLYSITLSSSYVPPPHLYHIFLFLYPLPYSYSGIRRLSRTYSSTRSPLRYFFISSPSNILHTVHPSPSHAQTHHLIIVTSPFHSIKIPLVLCSLVVCFFLISKPSQAFPLLMTA